MIELRLKPLVMTIAIGLLMGLMLAVLSTPSCSMTEPAEEIFPQPQPKPLTVTPHPTAKFDVVIVPPGTGIGGFTTLEPGLYIAGNALRAVVIKMGLTIEDLEEYQKGD